MKLEEASPTFEEAELCAWFISNPGLWRQLISYKDHWIMYCMGNEL